MTESSLVASRRRSPHDRKRPHRACDRSDRPQSHLCRHLEHARSSDYGNLLGIYMSADGGSTWTQLPAGPRKCLLVRLQRSRCVHHAARDRGRPVGCRHVSLSARSPRAGRPTPGRRGRATNPGTATTTRSPSTRPVGLDRQRRRRVSTRDRQLVRQPELDSAHHAVRMGHRGRGRRRRADLRWNPGHDDRLPKTRWLMAGLVVFRRRRHRMAPLAAQHRSISACSVDLIMKTTDGGATST